MNIVTIMNYDFKKQHDIVMCLMWAHSVRKAAPEANIIVLSEKPVACGVAEMLREYDFNLEVCPSFSDEMHHNYRFKLYNLTHLDYQYIFMDCDMLVMGNLEYLWDKRDDKPWIGIDHQLNIPGHTKNQLFLNSGLQIVGDPRFYKFKDIMATAMDVGMKYKVPGKDQAAIWTHFQKIGYDYTHPDIGPEWNACAGYTKLTVDDLNYWEGRCVGLGSEYPVYINHYWDKFKGHFINCPAYEWYTANCSVKGEGTS